MQTWCQADIARVVDKAVDRLKTRMGERHAAAVNGRDATIVLAAAFLRAFGVGMIVLVAMVIIIGHGSMFAAMGH